MEKKPSQTHDYLWRRKLSAAEREELRTQPDLVLEERLTAALNQLPNTVVPSNFTDRVLNAVELDERSAERAGAWVWVRRSIWPRLAVASAVLAVAGIGWQQHEVHVQHLALVQNLAQVAEVPTPSVEALENLDAIQRMSQPAHADTELLAAYQ